MLSRAVAEKQTWAYEEHILNVLGLSYSGLMWCELGNITYSGRPAKEMYVSKGVNHTSIDINGLGGSLPLNLDEEIPKHLENKFDIITNYGTTEHVGNQYSVFRNIHALGKVVCTMIHAVPLIGNWPKHCRYYYSKQFFTTLACDCNYSLVDIKIFNTGFYTTPKNLVVCVLKKVNNNTFIESKIFQSIKGIVDSGNVAKTGNYSVRRK